MKRLNNKGFAITAVIYGLAILGILLMGLLMSTMSQSRTNNKDLTRDIEDELNRFSQTETLFMGSVGDDKLPIAQEYIVPEGQTGWYKIELWGTQGGQTGGYGAYTSGIIKLTEGQVLYFYVGKQNETTGGASTDVRILKGAYNNPSSYQTRIMVAAGGGLKEGSDGGTLYGYSVNMRAKGGEVDCDNELNSYGIVSETNQQYSNGTIIGTPKTYSRSSIGQTTITSMATNNGGNGYFSSNDENVGGVSFISGYAGSKAINRGVLSNYPTYDYVPFTYDEVTDVYHYGTLEETTRYTFYDGMMLPGVQMGNGKARIERLVATSDEVTALPRKNQKLNNVRYIKDCVEGGSDTVFSAVAPTTVENNPDVAYGKSITTSGNCKIVDLGEVYPELEEIAVWHVNGDGKDIQNHTIEVSADNATWATLKGISPDTPYSETETVTGTHISAYQIDAMNEIPEIGNYYIQPVLSENKIMAASDNAETDQDPIGIDYINGLKNQKWAIELITSTEINPNQTNKEYKITELARNKALRICEDQNIANNRICADSVFNNYRRNNPQIWKVIPAGNGTYYIRAADSPQNASIVSGNIFPQTNLTIPDYTDRMLIGKNNADTQRFKLISTDYSSNK